MGIKGLAQNYDTDQKIQVLIGNASFNSSVPCYNPINNTPTEKL